VFRFSVLRSWIFRPSALSTRGAHLGTPTVARPAVLPVKVAR